MGTNYTCQVFSRWYSLDPHYNPERRFVFSTLYRGNRPLERVSASPRCHTHTHTHSLEVAGLDFEPGAEFDACALHCVSQGETCLINTAFLTTNDPVSGLQLTCNLLTCSSGPFTPQGSDVIEFQVCQNKSQAPGLGNLPLSLLP